MPDHGTSADIDEAAKLVLKDSERPRPGPKAGAVRLRIDDDFMRNAQAYQAGYRNGRRSLLVQIEFLLYSGDRSALELIAELLKREFEGGN